MWQQVQVEKLHSFRVEKLSELHSFRVEKMSELHSFRVCFFKIVQVGDLIIVHNNEIVPADVVVLSSSKEGGSCHIQTASLDGENYTRNEWRRCENYTRNEWRRWETTLETSREDEKLHSKRVEEMRNYTRNEWRRCRNYTPNECEINFKVRLIWSIGRL